jgi:hypothetical protein
VSGAENGAERAETLASGTLKKRGVGAERGARSCRSANGNGAVIRAGDK